jgi:hypothetical protein
VKTELLHLPSIHEPVQTEQGGPAARQGFAFQDRVAVSCCLEMLENESIAAVWCETYDDILILWSVSGGETAEFVQVKNEQPNQLWTLALLYSRDGAKSGTSVFERSLARDQFAEPSLFRIVTSRDVNAALAPMKLERNHTDRATTTDWFTETVEAIMNALPDAKYLSGRDCPYWLARSLWEVYSDGELDHQNKWRIHKVLEQLGFTPSSDECNETYLGLLATVKEAAEHPWAEREKRKIQRDSLIVRLREFADPFPASKNSERLSKKMERIALDQTYIENAQTMARHFRQRFRESQYIGSLDRGTVESKVTKCLHDLRVRLDSGELQDTALDFYSRCVEAVNAVARLPMFASTGLDDDFFSGCMYEITGRCGHRFNKITQ